MPQKHVPRSNMLHAGEEWSMFEDHKYGMFSACSAAAAEEYQSA